MPHTPSPPGKVLALTLARPCFARARLHAGWWRIVITMCRGASWLAVKHFVTVVCVQGTAWPEDTHQRHLNLSKACAAASAPAPTPQAPASEALNHTNSAGLFHKQTNSCPSSDPAASATARAVALAAAGRRARGCFMQHVCMKECEQRCSKALGERHGAACLSGDKRGAARRVITTTIIRAMQCVQTLNQVAFRLRTGSGCFSHSQPSLTHQGGAHHAHLPKSTGQRRTRARARLRYTEPQAATRSHACAWAAAASRAAGRLGMGAARALCGCCNSA
jgi:hypothetical protein